MDNNKVAEIVNPWLYDQKTGKKSFKSGTGYLIRKNLVLTVCHTLRFPDKYSKLQNGAKYGIRFLGDYRNGLTKWRNSDAILCWYSEEYDIALLKLEGNQPSFLTENSKDIKFGLLSIDNNVCAEGVGFPKAQNVVSGDTERNSPQKIEGKLNVVSSVKNDDLLWAMELSPLNPEGWSGISGTAVFVDQHLVGVVTKTDQDKDTEGYGSKVLRVALISRVHNDQSFCQLVFGQKECPPLKTVPRSIEQQEYFPGISGNELLGKSSKYSDIGILEYPIVWAWVPELIREKWFYSKSIGKLPPKLKIVLAWCSLCNYFNDVVLREILLKTQQEEFSDDLWHWIIGLGITREFPVADDFYQIKPSYGKVLQKYINKRSSRSELVRIFDKCFNNAIDPQYSSLYKAARIINQIYSNPSDITVESIHDIMSIFRYEESVTEQILWSLSEQLRDPNIYIIYQVAAAIPTRKNVASVFIFPAALVLEKVASRLRPRKLSVFPLYISSLVYQTWSKHEKSIETLKLAIDHLPDENSKSAGVLLSRLALSHIMIGKMSEAQKFLLRANIIFERNSHEWIDNQLNEQIWHMKRGYWQQALIIGLFLEESLKITDPYLKAKHAHILGVNYLYLGNLKMAEEYARKCEELSNHVTPSSWVIGKAWRNRFAYALLSTINLVNGYYNCLEEREKYFRHSLNIARDTTRQLSPLFQWILGCTVESHVLYTKASIAATRGDYLNAERKYLQLQQDQHLEAYYRITSKLDLAAIYLKTDRLIEAINLYQFCANKAFHFGFKYLEIRALKKVCEIDFDASLAARRDALYEDIYTIGSFYIDNLEFLIPV